MTDPLHSIVPCNFGIKFLQNAEHSNVTLILRNNERLLANSVILSLNSPVFERLTSELGLKKIELRDFNETAVQKFIESFYTGEMREIEEEHFRDLNKISHVFKVVWLSAKCRDYFVNRLTSLNEEDFDAMIFLFGEVCFMKGNLNDDSLSDLVIKHLHFLDMGECVVLKRYSEKLIELSKKDLDLVILLAGNNISFLLRCILSQVEKNSAIHENLLYLLNNMKLCVGKEQDAKTFDDLFGILMNMESLTTKELRAVVTLYSKTMDDYYKRKEKTATPSSRAMPNLFSRSFLDIRAVMSPVSLACQDFLGIPDLLRKAKDYADNMYMMVTVSCFIFTSFFQLYKVSCHDLSKQYINNLVENVIGQTIQELTRIRVCKGWSKICPDFLFKKGERVDYYLGRNHYETRVGNILNTFINRLKESEITSGLNSAEIQGRVSESLQFEEFLTTYRKYKFYFKHPAIEQCSEPGNCGFLLQVTPVVPGKPNSFNIELCTQPEEYDTDIHFHDVVSADKMHFAIKYRSSSDGQSQLLSPSYLGKPAWEEDMIFWDFCQDEFKERNAKWIRPIVYYDMSQDDHTTDQ